MSLIDPALLALIAAVSFGAAMVATKIGLRDMPAAAGASVSIPATTVLFWCLAPLLFDGGGWNGEAAVVFAAIGLFFPALVTLLIFESNRRMGPTVASTVSSTTPLFAVAGALVFLGETLSPPVAAGILAVILGVIALTGSGSGGPRHWPLWVLIIPLGAAAFRGSAQAAIKPGLALWPDPFAAALIGYTVSSAAILLAAYGLHRRRPLVYRARALPWFALAGSFNGFAVLVMYAALGRGEVTIVSPIVASYPVFTFLIGALVLRDERLTARVAFGVALTVAGVLVMAAR